MKASDPTHPQAMAADAERWRELILLLSRKAYKTNLTPEEIASQFPDLREIHRALRSNDQPPWRCVIQR